MTIESGPSRADEYAAADGADGGNRVRRERCGPLFDHAAEADVHGRRIAIEKRVEPRFERGGWLLENPCVRGDRRLDRVVAERSKIAVGGEQDAFRHQMSDRRVDRRQTEPRASGVQRPAERQPGERTADVPQQPIDPSRQRLRAHSRRRRRARWDRAGTEDRGGIGHVTLFGDRRCGKLHTCADDDVRAGHRERNLIEQRRHQHLGDVADLPAERIEVHARRLQHRGDVDAVRVRMKSVRANPV